MADSSWYDPTVEPTLIDALPTARAFPDLGLVSARSDWSPQATFVAFKCGKPNGEKAWALGHALEKTIGRKVIKTGHAHPDENSFILVRGSDYLAVDEGYSQKKQSCHHNTVLVDGKGQYREGVYNVADGLGIDWGGKLEAHFVGRAVVYARGEAAGAYDPALTLERFTRQMLFVGGKHVVVCDDLAARAPREFAWLLQTDAALSPTVIASEAKQSSSSNRHDMTLGKIASQKALAMTFENLVGDTRLRVSICEPERLTAQTSEQEIVAYPSASTPEWVLRHTQHTLTLTPARTTAARFVVALTTAPASAEPTQAIPLTSEAGSALALADGDTRTVVAFASDHRGIKIADLLETDARWVVANFRGDVLSDFAVGAATRLWIRNQQRFAADQAATLESEGRQWLNR